MKKRLKKKIIKSKTNDSIYMNKLICEIRVEEHGFKIGNKIRIRLWMRLIDMSVKRMFPYHKFN